MKLIVILSSILMLSGCGSVVKMYGDYADRNDLCQYVGKPTNYQLPDFCGAASKSFRVNSLGNNRYSISK